MSKIISFKVIGTVAVAVVLLAPIIAAAAVDTKSTTINASVNSTISMTTSGTVAIAVTPTASGAASSATDTVTVATNNSTGYILTLANSDAVLSLNKGGDSINAHTGTFAAPTTLATNSWGFRVDNAGTFGAGPTSPQSSQANLTGTWAGVPSTPVTLKNTATTATADVTAVHYGLKVDTSKPNGVYSDAVTYTATTN